MSELRTLRSLVGSLSERGDRTVVLSLQKEDVERWSYAELANYTRRLARGLAEAGVRPGEHVALLGPNSPRWVLACLAVVEAGAVITPLDVQLDEEMLAHALSDSGARLAFTTSDYAGKFEGLDLEDAPRLVLLDANEEDERGWRRLLPDEPQEEGIEIGPDDPAALFYTSGTTGSAKGVPLSHRNLAFQLNAILEAGVVRADDRVLLPLPLHHVYPFVIGVLTPLALGLEIIFPYALTGPQITRAANEGEATLIVGVPRLYSALYQAIQQQAESGGLFASRLFDVGLSASDWLRRRLGLRAGKLLLRPLHQRFGPKLRVVASGGSALDPELAGRLESLGWRVAQGYGLTETSPLLTLKAPDGKKLDSVGRPVPGVELCLDPSAVPDEDGEEPSGDRESRTREANRVGEILARGPGVFSGYRNMPEKTQEAFAEDGWYRTEDMGYLDEDGYLHVTGRVSTLIVTEGGKNVQPEDVEDAYLKSPVIEEIGVLQRDGKLVAVIVPDPNGVRQRGGETGEAVREAVNEQSGDLPSYRRLSDYAVSQEPLEYTRLGKLRRHRLEERYEKAKSGEEGEEAGPVSVEEMSQEDQDLLENPAARRAWDWLVDRYGDQRLTPDTSLQLDLGVDSMEWVNLTFEMGQSVGVELDEEAIGRVASVRDLLNEVAEAEEGGETSPSPVEQPDEVLSEEQKRFLRPLSPVEGAAARALFFLNRALARGVFGLRVEGLENVPKEGPFVIAPNHLSYLDAFAIGAALDYRRVRSTFWAAYAGAAYGNPINSVVSRLARAMPIDDEKAVFSSLAFGAATLKEGNGLVWFPEGQRSPDGELQRFERGIGLLLDHYRVPVVPVAISGTREAMPPGKALPRPAKVTVVFGEPLDPDDLAWSSEGDDPGDRILAALRDRVAELVARP